MSLFPTWDDRRQRSLYVQAGATRKMAHPPFSLQEWAGTRVSMEDEEVPAEKERPSNRSSCVRWDKTEKERKSVRHVQPLLLELLPAQSSVQTQAQEQTPPSEAFPANCTFRATCIRGLVRCAALATLRQPLLYHPLSLTLTPHTSLL